MRVRPVASSSRLATIIALPIGVPPSARIDASARLGAVAVRRRHRHDRAAVRHAVPLAELVDPEQHRLVRMVVGVAGELLDQVARGPAGDLDLALLPAVLPLDLVVHAAGDVDDDRGRDPLSRRRPRPPGASCSSMRRSVRLGRSSRFDLGVAGRCAADGEQDVRAQIARG